MIYFNYLQTKTKGQNSDKHVENRRIKNIVKCCNYNLYNTILIVLMIIINDYYAIIICLTIP